MKRRSLGVEVDGLMVALLLYVDDLAILAESEQDLQDMLNVPHEWTQEFDMSVNIEKTKVVHFRRGPSIPCTEAVFTLGDVVVQMVDRYHYLGLVLTQFMDLNITVRYVAQAAPRALRVLVAKSKSQGGLLFRVFTQLYDSLVQPILDYGASIIWGHKSFFCTQTCINKAIFTWAYKLALKGKKNIQKK